MIVVIKGEEVFRDGLEGIGSNGQVVGLKGEMTCWNSSVGRLEKCASGREEGS